jgi:uncharacterized protein (DUF58 family)
MGFAAVNTGNNLLFLVVSALLGFMAVSGVVGWRNIRGLRMQVELADEIYSGAATLVTLRLANRKRRFPSFLLSSTLLGHTATTCLLRGGAEETESFVHTFSGRGEKGIPPTEVRSPFPVNFFVRFVRSREDRNFLVVPSPLNAPFLCAGDDPVRSGISPAAAKGNDGDFARIGDYTGHEPMKLIHWRLSARHEDLKVREFSATTGEPLVIDIDTLSGGDLEERLSLACALINRLIGANRPVGLKLSDRVIAPAVSREHRLRLLGELALYGKD